MLPGATAFDTAIRTWIIARQTPVGLEAASIISRVGGVSVLQWLSVLFAIVFVARARRGAALAAASTAVLSIVAYAGPRRFLPRARPPGGGGYEATNSFPSAHATTSAAVCCTLAYLLWRERLVSAPAALAIAIVPPLCIGLSRLYLDVHWSTDVLAGWCAGLGVSAVAAGLYRLWPKTSES